MTEQRHSFQDIQIDWCAIMNSSFKKAYHTKWFCIVLYTLIFAVVSIIVFMPFLSADKSLLWSADGTDQHLIRFYYTKDYISGILNNLLSGKGLVIPMYDFQNGLITPDLQFGLPVILALFWPQDKLYLLYHIVTIACYFFCGLSVILLAWHFKIKGQARIIISALSYAFCGFAVYAGVKHPHFLIPMIMLPLMIIGFHKCYCEGRSYLLTIAVFLSITSHTGLYFSCMQAVLLLAYAIALIISDPDPIKTRFKRLGTVCIYGITGVLISGIVSLPTFFSLFSNGRIGRSIEGSSLFLYGKEYYKDFLFSLNMFEGRGISWWFSGFIALTVPAVVLLYLDKRKEVKVLKILFPVVSAMHLIPAIGYLMSGFNSFSNRFLFGYCLLISVIIMVEIPRFVKLSRREIVILSVSSAVYIASCLILKFGSKAIIYSSILAAFVLLTVLLAGLLKNENKQKILSLILCSITCLISIYLLSRSVYSESYITEFIPKDTDTVSEGSFSSLASTEQVINDNTFFRVENNCPPVLSSNTGFIFDLNTLVGYPYYGWANKYEDFLIETESPRYKSRHRLLGLQSDSSLLALTSVKYYVDRKDLNAYIRPYGFSQIDVKNNVYLGTPAVDTILKNDNYLPSVYSYDASISHEDFLKLDPVSRRKIMLKAVVLNDNSGLNTGILSDNDTDIRNVDFKVFPSHNGITIKGNEYTVKKGSVLILNVNNDKGREMYLRFNNLILSTGLPLPILVQTADGISRCWFTPVGYIYDSYEQTQTLNLGCSDTEYASIMLHFDEDATFKLDGIEIFSAGVEEVEGCISSLRENAPDNIAVGNDKVSCHTEYDTDRIVVFAFPNFDGWKAYIDGEEVAVLDANIGFVGVNVPAGSHDVTIKYTRPGIKTGAVLTAVGLVSLVALVITNRKKKISRSN